MTDQNVSLLSVNSNANAGTLVDKMPQIISGLGKNSPVRDRDRIISKICSKVILRDSRK